jgi:hypothetical protein
MEVQEIESLFSIKIGKVNSEGRTFSEG